MKILLNTQTKKDKYNGWTAFDTIMLTNKLQLDIKTQKMRGFVRTIGMVSHIENGFKSFVMYQDFFKVYRNYPTNRVTEKSVLSHHNMLDINTVITEAKEFYGV